jgi:hypothetical protein
VQLSLLHKSLNHNSKQLSLHLPRPRSQTFSSLHHVFRTKWQLWQLWQPHASEGASSQDNLNFKAIRNQISLGAKAY